MDKIQPVDTMNNEEIYMRMLIAHHMSLETAKLQGDGYMINLYYGFMNNTKHVLKDKERFGRSEEELQEVIAVIEDIVDTAIKNGRPRGQPGPSPSCLNPIAL